MIYTCKPFPPEHCLLTYNNNSFINLWLLLLENNGFLFFYFTVLDNSEYLDHKTTQYTKWTGFILMPIACIYLKYDVCLYSGYLSPLL